jgi:DnaJ-class molecular chaperone
MPNQEDCDSCGATGRITCLACNGIGEQAITAADGLKSVVPCLECRRTGKRPCPPCNGTGKK